MDEIRNKDDDDGTGRGPKAKPCATGLETGGEREQYHIVQQLQLVLLCCDSSWKLAVTGTMSNIGKSGCH